MLWLREICKPAKAGLQICEFEGFLRLLVAAADEDQHAVQSHDRQSEFVRLGDGGDGQRTRGLIESEVVAIGSAAPAPEFDSVPLNDEPVSVTEA